MRRILWDGATTSTETKVIMQAKPVAASPQQASAFPTTPTLLPKKVRSTNGHVVARKRDLTNSERDLLREIFIENDGRFDYKQCTKDVLPRMGNDVTVFQVSGFLSQIHVEVYKGQLQLKDPVAYYQLMANKYPRVHERYLKKYGELVGQQTGGNVPQPNFAAGVPKKKRN